MNRFRVFGIIFIGAVITILSACKGLDREKIANTYIIGLWGTPCQDQGAEGSSMFRISFNEYSEYSGQVMLFSDKDCLEYTTSNFQFDGIYGLGDKVETVSGLEAYELDMTVDRGDDAVTIVRVDGDIMYYGIVQDTPSNRPNELDLSEEYHRL